ncbi:hypothetical protein [Cryptosporangium minutisporangium]|uniref:Uncharacterized protein n=1 Tax=Cryptosporangium minutisporangium TaxID=113569 RepID=A0ABP6T8Y8_9ACTN
MAHAQMDAALAEGRAEPLASYVTDLVFYDHRWWLLGREHWSLLEDPGLLAELSRPRIWIEE